MMDGATYPLWLPRRSKLLIYPLYLPSSWFFFFSSSYHSWPVSWSSLSSVESDVAYCANQSYVYLHTFFYLNFLFRWRFVLFLGLPTLRTRRLHVNSVFFDSVLFDSPFSARAHVGSNFLIYFSFCLSYLFNVFSFSLDRSRTNYLCCWLLRQTCLGTDETLNWLPVHYSTLHCWIQIGAEMSPLW